MKVLVTGANGQLGYDVIKRLNALGDEPVGADRGKYLKLIRKCQSLPEYKLIVQQIFS